jgi:hypothetical protein
VECCGTCGRVGRRSGTRADGRLDLECLFVRRPNTRALVYAPPGANAAETCADRSFGPSADLGGPLAPPPAFLPLFS